MGSGCNTEFILICNLENDLTPSSIKDFIYKQTSILPQAFIFPRLLSDPFTRGVIMVDSEKKVQIIYEFLENPNHIVVSLRGRYSLVNVVSVIKYFFLYELHLDLNLFQKFMLLFILLL